MKSSLFSAVSTSEGFIRRLGTPQGLEGLVMTGSYFTIESTHPSGATCLTFGSGLQDRPVMADGISFGIGAWYKLKPQVRNDTLDRPRPNTPL